MCSAHRLSSVWSRDLNANQGDLGAKLNASQWEHIQRILCIPSIALRVFLNHHHISVFVTHAELDIMSPGLRLSLSDTLHVFIWLDYYNSLRLVIIAKSNMLKLQRVWLEARYASKYEHNYNLFVLASYSALDLFKIMADGYTFIQPRYSESVLFHKTWYAIIQPRHAIVFLSLDLKLGLFWVNKLSSTTVHSAQLLLMPFHSQLTFTFYKWLIYRRLSWTDFLNCSLAFVHYQFWCLVLYTTAQQTFKINLKKGINKIIE